MPAFVGKAKLVLLKRFMANQGVESNTAWLEAFVENNNLVVQGRSNSGQSRGLLPLLALPPNDAHLSILCEAISSILRGTSSTYKSAIERFLQSGKTEGYKLKMFADGQTSHMRG